MWKNEENNVNKMFNGEKRGEIKYKLFQILTSYPQVNNKKFNKICLIEGIN